MLRNQFGIRWVDAEDRMRRQLPPWAMGLAIAPLGFYFGFISTAMPILLSAKGVSVDEISKVSFIGFSPSF